MGLGGSLGSGGLSRTPRGILCLLIRNVSSFLMLLISIKISSSSLPHFIGIWFKDEFCQIEYFLEVLKEAKYSLQPRPLHLVDSFNAAKNLNN